MTLAYNTGFVLIWGSVALAVPAAIVLLGFSIHWTVPHEHLNVTLGTPDGDAHTHPLRFALGYAGAAVCLLWTLFMRLHGPRLHVRAGAWPTLGCCSDEYPTSEDEAVAAVDRIKRRYGRNPEIVGSGWGFFLLRRSAVGPRVFTHTLRGVDSRRRWLAGTTVREAARYYEEVRGQAFTTQPSMDHITLGSWFGNGNHGNGGNHPLTKGSTGTLKDAHALDMETMIVMTMDYPAIRRAFDAEPRRYFLLSVTFKDSKQGIDGALIDNVWLKKQGIIVDSAHSADQWLADDAHLRVLFAGAARAYGLGLRWHPVKNGYEPDPATDHIDPHCCQRFCTYAQLDLCSVSGGCHEPLVNFRGYQRYADANRWMPLLFPTQTVFLVVSGFRNFEILFKLPYPLTGVTLWELVRALVKMHNEIGGRSEIRYGKTSADTTIFLDMALRKHFDVPFRLLHHQFGVQEVALHPGKYQPSSTAPCQRVPQNVMYGMQNSKLAVEI
jgi:hypothetical protein